MKAIYMLCAGLLLLAACQPQAPQKPQQEADAPSTATVTGQGTSSTQGPRPNHANHLEALARQYFAVYAARQDFDSLMAFYAPEAQLYDYSLGLHCPNRDSLQAFYNWHNGTLEMLTPRNLTVEHLALNTRITVAKGYFHPFVYNGQRWENYFHFTIWLHWNDEGKIVRQEDWIMYPLEFIMARATDPNSWITPPKEK